ncbi:hypothetical protein N185_36035 [Sinorhizobium sp. GW3]|nr:hypothetical protein N185_36035 [Sinorhizobium sp. GW3]
MKALNEKVAKLDKSALPSVLHIDKVADQIQVIANGLAGSFPQRRHQPGGG